MKSLGLTKDGRILVELTKDDVETINDLFKRDEWPRSTTEEDLRQHIEFLMEPSLWEPQEPRHGEYKGWITAPFEDAEELTSLGVRLGMYDLVEKTFSDCFAPPEALKKLDKHWGRWIWGFTPRESST